MKTDGQRPLSRVTPFFDTHLLGVGRGRLLAAHRRRPIVIKHYRTTAVYRVNTTVRFDKCSLNVLTAQERMIKSKI